MTIASVSEECGLERGHRQEIGDGDDGRRERLRPCSAEPVLLCIETQRTMVWAGA